MVRSSDAIYPTHVLLIDDNEDDYIFTRELLAETRRSLYKLDWVDTFEAGLTAILAQTYDAYLLDYRLSNGDGLAILQQAVIHRCRAPIIVLTGATDDQLDLEAMQLGATDFLQKGEINANMIDRVLRYALHQKRVELALQEQAEREHLIRQITQHIRASLDLDQVLITTVSEVRQLLNTDRVVIYRFYPDWSGEVIVESVRTPELSIWGEVIADSCFVMGWHERYRQGRISAIDNVKTSSIHACHKQLLQRLHVQANLVLPLLQGDGLWGLLIAHQCQAPRHWYDSEIELLSQVASQVMIALQQSELYQQVQTLNANLEEQVYHRTAELQLVLDFEATLKRITDRVRDSLNERHILQAAIEELSTVLQATSCDVGWYNDDETVTVRYEHAQPGVPPVLGLVIPLQHLAEVHNHIRQGNAVQFCVRVEPPSLPRTLDRQYTILACPLQDEQGVFGNLWIFRPPQLAFSDLEVRLVQQVATQCAIALRQARLYKAAQAQVDELSRLNRAKDDFLNTVSHELRTPMSNIKMAIQMLEIILKQAGILGVGTVTVDRYFQILQDECRREIGLINDLLDLARLDANAEPLIPIDINLYAWIPHIAEPFLERSRNQQQQLEIVLPPDLPLLQTNLESLERILTELLNNACKYTPSGERIGITVHPAVEQVQIRVTNTGVEIPEAERDRVFDRFYRILSNDPWKHGGTGLGLALIKKLSEYLGGSLQLESGNAQTTFTLTLPLHPLPDSGYSDSPPLSRAYC